MKDFNTKFSLYLIQYQKSKGYFMLLSEDVKPISYLKTKTADVIKTVTDTKRTIIITQNGEAKAVVQDIKTYENLQNSLNMLKMIIQSENDIEKKDYLSQEEMFDTLEKRLFE
jgi:prevent-host-death family protein